MPGSEAVSGERDRVGYRSDAKVCARCGQELPLQWHQGRPRRWCSETCRVAAWRARRRRAARDAGQRHWVDKPMRVGAGEHRMMRPLADDRTEG